MVWDYWQGNYLVDPVRQITSRTGKTALILLLLSLACTPVNTLLGIKQVLKVRRALGLYAFMYAGLHFLTFVGLDYRFNLNWIWQAIVEQRYTLVGAAALLLLVALAITSTRGWQKRLGKRWKRLHRTVYLVGALVVVHFMWSVKDPREPWLYGGALLVLLLMRLPRVRKTISNTRRRLTRRNRADSNPLDAPLANAAGG